MQTSPAFQPRLPAQRAPSATAANRLSESRLLATGLRRYSRSLAGKAPGRRPVLISEDVRAFLEQPHFAVMGTINASGTPQLTVMWYALVDGEDVVLLNATRGLLK